MTTSPQTSRETLQLLETYHQKRHDIYAKLATESGDERPRLLLQFLTRLEEDTLEIIRGEKERMGLQRDSYLMPGATLTIDPAHAMDCRCGEKPTFDDALACALTSDAALDELIDRLEGSSAASSIQDLAARLREAERVKDRQIAKFTRED